MIYGVGLRYFGRKLRQALLGSNRKSRRRNRQSNSLARQQSMEVLEDRTVPATFTWKGGGVLFRVANGQEFPIFTDLNGGIPAPDYQLAGSDFTKGSYNWSDPRNWVNNIVPNDAANADLVFDYRQVIDFDSAPGTSDVDANDSNADWYGSFFGINDVLTTARSITIISSTASSGSSWEFKMKAASPAFALKMTVSAGIRTQNTTRPGASNIWNIDLVNGNSVNGFNLSVGDTSPLTLSSRLGFDNASAFIHIPVINALDGDVPPFNSTFFNDIFLPFDDPASGGNIDLFDSANNVGGVLNTIVGTTSTDASLTLNGKITGAGAGDGSRLFKTGPGRLTIASKDNSYNGLTTIDQGVVILNPDAKLGNDAGDTILKTNAVAPSTLLLTASFVDPFAVEHFAEIPANEDIYMETGTKLQGQNNARIKQGATIFLLGAASIEASDDAANGIRSQFFVDAKITDGNFQPNDVTFFTGIDIDSYIVLASSLNNYSGSTIVTGERLLKLAPDNGVGDSIAGGTAGVIPNASRVVLTDKASLDLNDFLETIGSVESTTGNSRIFLGLGRLTTGTNNLDTLYAGRISSAVSASGDQGGITKVGSGAFTLSGNNTYTGRTVIQEGTLRLGASGVIDDLNRVLLSNQAIFDLNNFNEIIGSLEGGTTNGVDFGPSTQVHLGSATLTVGNNGVSTSYDGVISGTGGLTKRGAETLILGGANTYTGATAVIGGVLQMNKLPQRLSSTTAVTVDPGAVLNLNNLALTIGSLAGGYNAGGGWVDLGIATLTVGTNDASTTYRGRIVGSGGLTKTGLGTLTLLNPLSTYTGPTNVDAGTLTIGDFNNPFGINGTITSDVTVKNGAKLAGDGTITASVTVRTGGTFAPSNPLSIHAMTIGGNLTLQANSTYEQRIADVNLYSRVNVGGVANLGFGTATLTLIVGGSYIPVDLAEFAMLRGVSTSPDIVGFFTAGSPLAAKPDGSYIKVGSNLFRITYTQESGGGLGNDIILKSLLNNAPIITDTSTIDLTTIPEDTVNPAGDLISSFATPRITDNDFAAVFGIAIFATSQLQSGDTGPLTGTWQYFDGSTWIGFGAVSSTSALLLPEGYRVRFVPNANRNGRVGFSFRAWDQTVGGAGGRADINALGTGGSTAFSANAILASLTVGAVIDNPVLDINGGPLNYVENSGLQVVAPTATLFDQDAVNLNGATLTVTFTANGSTADQLTIRSQGNVPGQVFVLGNVVRYSGVIVGSFAGGVNGAPLVMTFNSNATVTSAQAVLQNVGFRNDSDAPSPLTRTVEFVITDGAGGISAPVLQTINFQAVNDGPTLIVPPAFFNTIENVSVAITGISVGDIDAGNSLVSLVLSAVNGKLTISTNVIGGVGVADVASNGTASVTITASVAAINATLAAANGVSYLPNLNFNGGDSISATVNDLGNTGTGGPLTAFGSMTVVVAAVNSAPINHLPAGTLAATEDVALLITGISVEDADVGNGPIIVTFSVLHGVMFFKTNVLGGVPSNQINGNGTATVSLAFGTLAQVNATLAAGFDYVARTEVNVTDVLTVSTNDLGNTGSGGPLTDTDTINILVTSVNDAPSNVMPASFDVFTNTDSAINSIYSNDPDALDGTINVAMSVVHGTLRFNTAAAAGVVVGGNGSNLVTLAGKQSNVNLILATMVYRSTLNYVGADTLTMLVNDNGNTGTGGPLSTSSSATINVKARSTGLPGQAIPKPDVIGRLNGQWWVGDSDGTSFVNRYFGTWSTNIQWVDVNVADVSGDGADDVIGRDAATGVWWAGITTPNGFVNRTFGAWSPIKWDDVRIADVNADGLVDVIGRDASTGNWWGGVSSGLSFSNVYLGTWTASVRWVDVLALDVNGDGKTDVVGRDGDRGVWYVGTSNGAQFQNAVFGAWAPTVVWVDVKVADVNGDGLGDIVGRDSGSGNWWSGISNTSAFLNQYLGTWTPSIQWIDVQATDLNGDDKTDVVGRDAANGQWWAGISDGSKFSMSLFGAWSPGAPWVDVQTIDVNSDGKLDIVGRLQNTGDWWVARSNGSTFTNVYFGRWSPNQAWVDVKVGSFEVGTKSAARPTAPNGTNSGAGTEAETAAAVYGSMAPEATVDATTQAFVVAPAASAASASYRSVVAKSERIDALFSRPRVAVRSAIDLLADFDGLI